MEDKRHSKRNFVLVIISALIMLAIVGTLTYAYFTADVTSLNNLKINASVSNDYKPIFTAYPDGNLALLVTTADMLDGDASNDYSSIGDTASQTYHVNLLAYNHTCTFALSWKDNSTEAYVISPQVANLGLNEYVIKVENSSGDVLLEETSIKTLQDRVNVNNEAILVEGLSITSYDSLASEIYTITATIYNLDVVQTIYNKNYISSVGVTNIVCE